MRNNIFMFKLDPVKVRNIMLEKNLNYTALSDFGISRASLSLI